MRNIRNILSVVCGYVAAVIGAGFASGQEIISFFVKYGKYSIIGVLLFVYYFFGVCVCGFIGVCRKKYRNLFGLSEQFF